MPTFCSIKEYRTRMGLSQTQFAAKFCINIGTLRSWEQGVNRCPEYVLCLFDRVTAYEAKYGELQASEEAAPDLGDRFSFQSGRKPKAVTGSYQNLSAWAKYYQFSVIYAREIAMWKENLEFRGKPLRQYLIENRVKYKNRSAEELTESQILSGFTIAGVLRGYTTFDVTLMREVLDRYDIQSVYDPCAGWGERMLCCYLRNLSYIGVDVNPALNPGYARMIIDFGMTKQTFSVGDSAKLSVFGSCDAVITCPPYGNTELYSPYGAEQLSESAFLDWWWAVVENSKQVSPKYFCFQVNQAWKTQMSDIVESCGFRFLEGLSGRRKSSHFMKRNGVNLKQEYETMLVFERV